MRRRVLLVAAPLLLAGCQSLFHRTVGRRSEVLRQAGFTVLPATGLERRIALSRLPAGRISLLGEGARSFFLYPDGNALLVGNSATYRTYRSVAIVENVPVLQEEAVPLPSGFPWDWASWGGVPDGLP